MEAARSHPQTPLPPLHFLRALKELRSLLSELSSLTHADQLWGIQTLRSQLSFAFQTPSSLVEPLNQVDLAACWLDAICEAAEAGWGGLRGQAAFPGPSRGADRSAARLYELTADISDAVGVWRRAGSSSAPLNQAPNPEALPT
ncbi:MAG: hypothetical protein JF888_13935 [Candidatus Dormibacteraeota bacterium]|uniref:Uncharacterized protein n=1 Tax=Candidatus Dormiibacter inghamiae TaxID=3127013 RepID=A0A934KK50_9BACT|nr:hypothetical protein [Candidatus Dormibacteraeota bacterium]MBJ7605315.1 hypothetical protein [Candidatus Dormibacteraeota bacterium]